MIPKDIMVKKQIETAKKPIRFVVMVMSMSSALFMTKSLAQEIKKDRHNLGGLL